MIKDVIDVLINEMTLKEKQIAEYILNHQEEVLKLNSTEIAIKINVGQSSIIKFIKKIGFKKFADFKIQLSKEIENNKYNKNNKILHSKIYIDDSLEDISKKLFNETVKALKNTIENLDYAYFDKIIDIIKNSKKVLIIGSGMSSIVARNLELKLMKINIDAFHYESPHMQLMKLATMEEDDLVIAISHRGETKDVIEVVKKAKSKGLKILSFTSIEKNTVSNLSDYNLKVISDENVFRTSAISSRMAHLILIDNIFLRLVQKDYTHVKKYIDQSSEIIKNL